MIGAHFYLTIKKNYCMKIVLALLTGSIMLNLTTAVIAQPGKYSGQALPRLFSIVARSYVGTDTPVKGSGVATSGVAMGGVAIAGVANGRLPAAGPGKEDSRAAISEEALKVCCEKVENDKRRIYYLSTRNGRMVMQIKGIYTRESLLFFHLSLCNRSHLDYDLDSIRFFIADKGGLKGIARKVTELKPVYVQGNMKIIRGKSLEPSVIALRRFTLPPGKHLLIEAREKNGGRHLQLQTDNNTLVRARLI
jgi:hypothetical protein